MLTGKKKKKKADLRETSTLRSRISNYILAVFNLLFLHIERKPCACMFVRVTVCVSLCSPMEESHWPGLLLLPLLHSFE